MSVWECVVSWERAATGHDLGREKSYGRELQGRREKRALGRHVRGYKIRQPYVRCVERRRTKVRRLNEAYRRNVTRYFAFLANAYNVEKQRDVAQRASSASKNVA